MTDLNIPNPKPFMTIERWCIVCLLAACIILYLTRGCGSQPPAVVTQNKSTNDSVAKLLAVVQQSNIETGILREDSIQQAATIQQQAASLAQLQHKLDQANKTATDLANDVVAARERLDSIGYIHACDSLAVVTLRDNHIKDSLALATRRLEDTYDKVLTNLRNLRAECQTQATGYKAAYDLVKKQNDALVKAVNPTRKLFIGGEVVATPTFGAVGPGLLYEGKDGKIIGLSGGIATTGSYWVGVKAYIKIQLHK